MARFRRVNMYGTRYVIELMKTDMTDLKLKCGDFLDIEDFVIKKGVKSK